jgi:aminoglycoside phosphotransferase (APT) family kinase protein
MAEVEVAMIFPPETALMHRDPSLPGLRILLDPQLFMDRLSRALPGKDLRNPRITYVKYEPQSNCLVGYRLQSEDTEVQLSAIAYRSNIQRELQIARNRRSVAGPLGPGRLVLEDCATVVSIFPNDSKLKGLRTLADREARKGLLVRLLPDRSELWEGTLECLAYKPQRRYVARWCGQDAEAILKFYNPKVYRFAQANARAFQSRGSFRLPKLLGACEQEAALAFEWLPGVLLSKVISDPQLEPQVLVKVGEALADLQGQGCEGLPCTSPESEAGGLSRIAEALGFAFPTLAKRAQEVARRLSISLVEEPAPCLPIHGDFNPTQVLLSGDKLAILDLDRAGQGDPAFDLGNFLSHLERDALAGRISPARLEKAKDALLQGYRPGFDPDLVARTDLYTAARLFQQLHPFRYWQPQGPALPPRRFRELHWPECVETTFKRIEEIMRNHPSAKPPKLFKTSGV